MVEAYLVVSAGIIEIMGLVFTGCFELKLLFIQMRSYHLYF
jgi:hypothetical protein